ncbi:MAG: DegT/DnrJ/EryC1/StrS family aminotransferase [Melioribacteraceae bacterium]|nr:DegT/DnrJ/EryC1/StrS family aminotransferase [Melioribacteraceae bacterium]
MISIFTNTLDNEEINAIKEVLESRWIGFGPKTKEFENKFAEKINAEYCLMVNSASAATYLVLKTLGIGKEDEVIIPTINFIACPNSVIELGGKPVFADVDLNTFNLLPQEIERLRTDKTKAIILLHYGGHPIDYDSIKEVSKDILIIEDSANSILSKYKGKSCGTLGDAGFFSFDAMKTLSTGDGGAIVIKNEFYYEKLQSLRFLGLSTKKTSGFDSFKEKNNQWWEIELDNISNRFLMNDINAAIGIEQLKKIDYFIEKRKSIWNIYQNELKEVEQIQLPPEPLADTQSSYYLYWIKVKNNLRDKLAKYLVENGIYVTFRYYPLHLIKIYNYKERLPNSESILDEALNIPLHQNLSESDIDKIITTIKKFFKQI